jgi:O-antigen/teichoic acid export membrane protein
LLLTLLAIACLQGLVIVLAVLRFKIVSIWLGPAGLGVIGTIDQIVQTLVQLSALGLPPTAVKFLSRSHSESSAAFRRTFASFLRALAALCVGGSGLAILVVAAQPRFLPSELLEYRHALMAALATVPCYALVLYFSNVLATAKRPLAAVTMQVALGTALVLATWVGLRTAGLSGVYWAALVMVAAVVALSLWYLHRNLHLPLLEPNASVMAEIRQTPEVLTASLLNYLSLSLYAGALLAPRYFVLHHQGAEQAGLLQAVLAIVLALGLVLGAMNAQYLTPLIHRRSAPSDKFDAAVAFQTRQIILLAVAALPLVLFPELVLSLAYSPRFVTAASWLAPLLVWQLLILQASVLQQLLFSVDDLIPMTVITCGGYSASILLCATLAPVYGIAGVTTGMLGAAVVMTLACWGWLRAQHSFHVSSRLVLLLTYVCISLLIARPAAVRLSPLVGHVPGSIAVGAGLLAGLPMFVGSRDWQTLKLALKTYF